MLKPLGLVSLVVVFAFALTGVATAHLERPSYWPDPRPDTSVTPAAGGEVPRARSLFTAVTGRGPGEVRVVCQRGSLRLALRSINRARRNGYRIRPSQSKKRLSSRMARRLARANRAFFAQCEFRHIQDAVNASGNNDRVVIMPGRYTEPKSRRAPVNDPRCNPSLLQNDQEGTPTPSYEYQATCPNDQNLVYVQGRAVKGKPLPQPRPDRHGIPEQELGECIRCNLQIEGSGVIPEDVVIDGGTGYRNPRDPYARPGEFGKHVILRTDRSDGFVGRNFTLRGAKEHGFYTEETDGVLLDRTKFFWNADYGHLSFTTDHNVVQNCDGFGAGDAVVYPGASPQTGEFRDESVYPEQRFNSVIRRCDLHGSTLAYSGSMGNSVRITENHIYANTAGISSDTYSAPGHPGYPADGLQVDNNYIYSNNLDLYNPEEPSVEPLVPMPIGSGIVWPGMNGASVKNNHIFDNWRYGTVQAATPDALVEQLRGPPDGNVDRGVHCDNTQVSTTSCDNVYENNVMGRPPANFKFNDWVDRFGNRRSQLAESMPNGTDFWWDEFAGNDGNCWRNNIGPDGTGGSITGSGQGMPPDPLPSDCGASIGNGDPLKELQLADCVLWERGQDGDDRNLCVWFDMPPQPGTAAARAERREFRRKQRAVLASPRGQAMVQRIDGFRALTGTGDQR